MAALLHLLLAESPALTYSRRAWSDAIQKAAMDTKRADNASRFAVDTNESPSSAPLDPAVLLVTLSAMLDRI